MLALTDYETAHKNHPFAVKYSNVPDKCFHNYSFVVFCNGKRDIVRCQKCGDEIETSCDFDDEYD